jgi:hypothetical protein
MSSAELEMRGSVDEENVPWKQDDDNRAVTEIWCLLWRHPLAKRVTIGYYHRILSTVPQKVDSSDVYTLTVTDKQRDVIAKCKPIYNGKKMSTNWMDVIFKENSPYYFYYNRKTNTLTKLLTRICRIRGGFQTRSTSSALGQITSTTKDFNNESTSRNYRAWPEGKVHIPGTEGGCSIISAYYICPEVDKRLVAEFMNVYHEKLQLPSSQSILVTDGTYEFILSLNRKLKNFVFTKVYPTRKRTPTTANLGNIIGDSENVGKFLLEISEKNIALGNIVSHFVSLDTEKMEIYDPMSERGAICMYRNSSDHCIFLEILFGNSTNFEIVRIWKLEDKQHACGEKRECHALVKADMNQHEKKRMRKRKDKRKNKEVSNIDETL